MITPQDLRDREFKYTPFGIGGQDMWAGLPFWEHPNGLVLRGSVSTSGRGHLFLYPHFNTKIENLIQLDNLLSIFTK